MDKSWINWAALALIVTATCAQADDPSGFWNYSTPTKASACEPDVSAASEVARKWGRASMGNAYTIAAMARQVSLHECGCMYTNYGFSQFTEDALGKRPGDLQRNDPDALYRATEKFQAQQVPWLQMQKTICKGKS